MIRFNLRFLFMLLFAGALNQLNGQSSTLSFIEYARLEVKAKGVTGTGMSLEYAIKEQTSETKIYWRITNYSASDLYDVDLNDLHIMFSNNTVEKFSSFRVGNIKAGEEKLYPKTVLSSSDFSKYGKIKIVSVKIKEPVIEFKPVKNGESESWSKYGTVVKN